MICPKCGSDRIENVGLFEDSNIVCTEYYKHQQAVEEMAKKFHTVYERLAPEFGYKTREASAVPWENVPKNNKDLMIAVCEELIREGY